MLLKNIIKYINIAYQKFNFLYYFNLLFSVFNHFLNVAAAATIKTKL
jgi:hypothetical protein